MEIHQYCPLQISTQSYIYFIGTYTSNHWWPAVHKDAPCENWKLHELHQHLSATNITTTITITLSQELSKMKVTDLIVLHNAWMHLTPNLRNLMKYLLLIYLHQWLSVSWCQQPTVIPNYVALEPSRKPFVKVKLLFLLPLMTSILIISFSMQSK